MKFIAIQVKNYLIRKLFYFLRIFFITRDCFFFWFKFNLMFNFEYFIIINYYQCL